MSVTLSTNVDDKTALKIRIVARKENRSVSNIISSALAVFTALPKEVRDSLLELQSQQDSNGIKRFAREIMVVASRKRLEAATEHLAAENIFGGPDSSMDEMDMLEEATRLTEEP